jgi:hypothetical protein
VNIARRIVVALCLVAVLIATTRHVQAYRDRPYLHANLYLPSGKFVEQSSLGYREIAADWVWFQSVQYFGGWAKGKHDLAYFCGLIDIVTDLDPHFTFAYIFGAVVAAQDMRDLPRGLEILRKGMRHNPREWQFPFEMGFLWYVIAQDTEKAARYFDLASRLPGGGDKARRFAAFVYSKAGHEETSLRMWEELANSDQPEMRIMAKFYVDKLRAGKPLSEPANRGSTADDL